VATIGKRKKNPWNIYGYGSIPMKIPFLGDEHP
jgi:hypothetical protein